jgi:eukaryotic-like serine/threonine-protein kinase
MHDLPRQLGPYQLVRKLGSGGMAQVHLALAFGASGFEKKVAIKSLLPEFRGHGELQRLLITEACLHARLEHRNLVGVHDLGVADGAYYVRMDFVDGGDLASMMKFGRPSVSLAIYIAEEVALALHYVHTFVDERSRPLGLVHRDVSPSNILLSRAGEVKLADFGVAKATRLADATGARVRKGKYAYMSPEQLAGDVLTHHSDQFGLGVTIMQMIVGHRPFDGETVLETMEKIREAEPPALEGVTPELQTIIRRCLERRPKKRYPSALALRQALMSLRSKFLSVGPPELQEYVLAAAVEGPSLADQKTQV